MTALGQRLDSLDQLKTTCEVLWKPPKSFKAIDFVAKVKVPQGLPDHGFGEGVGREEKEGGSHRGGCSCQVLQEVTTDTSQSN